MRCYPISTRINRVANDDEECSAPVELAEVQIGFSCSSTVGQGTRHVPVLWVTASLLSSRIQITCAVTQCPMLLLTKIITIATARCFPTSGIALTFRCRARM